MSGLTPWNSREQIEQYESLFPVLPEFVAHHTLNLKFGPTLGLPDKFSLHLAEDLFAVLIADRMQVGIEYAKKRYGKEIKQCRWLGLTERIDRLYKNGRDGLGYYSSLSMDQPLKEGTFDEFASQFFYRNLASFDAAKRLSELGYLCEVSAILRAALEQFAFSAELRNLTGSEKLENLRPNNSIGWLKKRLVGVGRLYGMLSKYVHFEFEHHSHFFAYSPKEVLTLQRSSVLRAYATHLLLLTMICVSRYLLKNAPDQFGETPQPIQELAEFIQDVEKYSKDVCSMLPSDYLLHSMNKLLCLFTNDLARV